MELVVKPRGKHPTRGAIGQLITAAHLLEKTNSTQLKVNMVIECEERGDESLAQVCESLHIVVPRREPNE